MLPPSGSRPIFKAFEEHAHLRGWHGRWVDMGGGRRRHEVTGPGEVSHVKESKTAFTHASYRPPEAGANSGVQFHTSEAVARKRASGPFTGGEVIPLKGEGDGPAKLEPELSGIDDMAARARRADERRMRQIEQDRQRKAPTPAPKPKGSAGGTVEKPKLVKRDVGARNPSQSSRLKKKYDVLVNGEKVGEVRQVQHMIRLGGAYTTGWAPDFTEWKFYEGSNNFPHEVRLRQAHTRAELMPRVVEHLKSKQPAPEAKPKTTTHEPSTPPRSVGAEPVKVKPGELKAGDRVHHHSEGEGGVMAIMPGDSYHPEETSRKVRVRLDSGRTVGFREGDLHHAPAHDLTRMTPTEVDERWATAMEPAYQLSDQLAAAHASLRKYQRAGQTPEHLTERIAQLEPQLADARRAGKPFDAEYKRRGGWPRYVQVANSNGHVHRSPSSCGSITPMKTLVRPLPELSGETDEGVVVRQGHVACTKCFPNAPVKQKPQDKGGYCSNFTPPKNHDYRRVYQGARCPTCGAKTSVTPSGRLRAHKPPAVKKSALPPAGSRPLR